MDYVIKPPRPHMDFGRVMQGGVHYIAGAIITAVDKPLRRQILGLNMMQSGLNRVYGEFVRYYTLRGDEAEANSLRRTLHKHSGEIEEERSALQEEIDLLDL